MAGPETQSSGGGGGTRLADRESLLSGQEEALSRREEAILRRERAYIGCRLALADTERDLRNREASLFERARTLGKEAEVIARLTAPRGDVQKTSPPTYTSLEVAQAERGRAVKRREEALVARNSALEERIRLLDLAEKGLPFEEEMLRVRSEEVARMEGILAALEAKTGRTGKRRTTPGSRRRHGSTPSGGHPGPALLRPAVATQGETPLFGGSGSGGGDFDIDVGDPVPSGAFGLASLLSSSGEPPRRFRNPEAEEQVAPLSPRPLSERHGRGSERRREPRVGLKVYVGLESEHNFYTGFTHDISAGGVFIATHDVLPIGKEVELLFHLPSGRAIHCQGRVAWTREYTPDSPDVPPGMGVKFLGLPPDAVAEIQRFTATREPLFFEDE